MNGKLDRTCLARTLEYVDADGASGALRRRSRRFLPGDLRAGARGWSESVIDDSFFDLGGDSLSAMRLVAARSTHGLDTDLRGADPLFDCAHGCLDWRRSSVRAQVPASRWLAAAAAQPSCRCPTPNSDCGSWSSCKARRRSTTWRWRCG